MNPEKSKLKNGLPERNKFLFLILWIIGHGAGWGVLYSVFELFNLDFDSFNYALVGLIVGGVISVAQYALIRWQFHRNIKWWIPLSVIAWIFASMIPFQLFMDINLGSTRYTTLVQAMALFAPSALVQIFLLRKYVKQAWLWLLASITGTAIFVLFGLNINHYLGEPWGVSLGYSFYASATALTLLWLFGMSKMPEKQKISESTHERLADETRHILQQQDYEEDVQQKYMQ